jgi:hypothetical protein
MASVSPQDLSEFASDSDEQQAAVLAVADVDAFQWGYDPVHYGVPEGSYASCADGPTRILEYRQMVQALHALGLRVVLDVVYNHTFASGEDGRTDRQWPCMSRWFAFVPSHACALVEELQTLRSLGRPMDAGASDLRLGCAAEDVPYQAMPRQWGLGAWPAPWPHTRKAFLHAHLSIFLTSRAGRRSWQPGCRGNAHLSIFLTARLAAPQVRSTATLSWTKSCLATTTGAKSAAPSAAAAAATIRPPSTPCASASSLMTSSTGRPTTRQGRAVHSNCLA